jgi:hypothetical protein
MPMLQDPQRDCRTCAIMPRGGPSRGVHAVVVGFGTVAKLDTDPDLADSIVEYVQQRGAVSMEDIVQEAPSRFQVVGKSQD